jgi:hypothetical protein
MGESMSKKNRVVWEMSQLDSDLLQETLQMDAVSHSFSPPLRQSIAKALDRVKWYDAAAYRKKVFEDLKIERSTG